MKDKVVIKSNKATFRDGKGNQQSTDMLSDKTTEERIKEINQTAEQKKTEIVNKGNEVLATIPPDYTKLKEDLDGLTDLEHTVNSGGNIDEFAFPLSIGSSGVWQLADTSTHTIIPVKNSDKVKISANSSNMTIYAILTEHNNIFDKVAKFSTDSNWNSRKTIAKGTVSEELTMPHDAKYLYLCVKVSGNNYFPKSIVINGAERNYCIRGKIDQIIDNVSDLVANEPYTIKYRKQLDTSYDIDTMTEKGYFMIGASASGRPSGNYPDDFSGQRLIFFNYALDTRLCQMMVNSVGTLAVRLFADGAWKKWNVLPSQEETNNTITYRRGLNADENIDSLTNGGIFIIGASSSNRPSGVYPKGFEGQKLTLFSYTAGNRLSQMMVSKYGTLAIRMWVDGVWTEWNIMASKDDISSASDTMPFLYNNVPNTSELANEGTEITILSYNVGVYNNGNTSAKGLDASIFDEKVFNIKKFIMDVNPYLIGLQEDTTYVDRLLAKDAHNYLYKPIFPNRQTEGGSSVYSKVSMNKKGSRPIGNSRYMAWCEVLINGKILLFVSMHPSPDTVEHRLSEYENVFTWINGRTYEWCIVSGDFNTIEEQDRVNLKNLCDTNGFTMANGGYLGWLKTTPTPLSLDNILVNEKCIINSVKVHSSEADNLYSDHYPISAKITLLM